MQCSREEKLVGVGKESLLIGWKSMIWDLPLGTAPSNTSMSYKFYSFI